jgi:hypothetical protein
MLRIANLEELEGQLLRVPEVVRAEAGGPTAFSAAVLAWLADVERTLAANRLAQAGAIAALRSAAAAAADGGLPVGLQLSGTPTRRKLARVVASHLLQRAAELLGGLLAEPRARLGEAERVAQQIVAAARARGLVPARDPAVENTEYLKAVRRALAGAADVQNAAVHLEGLVGPHDTLVLLDRTLSAI